MPRRPESHVRGDRAATTVAGIFESCGFSVERISQDYGEDLLVQTVLGDLVDPGRMWVQVKGRAKLTPRRDGTYVERVSTLHARRWVRSADPVIYVVWDFEHDRGIWTHPVRQIDEWDLVLPTGKQSTQLVFDPADLFDRNTALDLAWESRLSHYNLLVLRANEEDQLSHQWETTPRPSLRPLIVFDFLRAIGFVNEVGIVCDGGQAVFDGELENLNEIATDESSEETEAELELQAAALALLHHVEESTKQGIPATLMHGALELAHRFLSGEVQRSLDDQSNENPR